MAEEETTLRHPRIEEVRILDRYLAGELPPAAADAFEEHLFECEACLEQAEWGERLRRGLGAVAAEDSVRAGAARGLATLGLLAWLRSRRPAELAAFSGLALALVLLGALAFRQQGELERLRRGAGLAAPTGGLQVVSLGVVRGEAEGIVEVRPDPDGELVLLSLELPLVEAERYRVRLGDAAGREIWRGEDLVPNLYDTLLVALPANFLAPGEYRIALEALTASGAEPAGELSFRVPPPADRAGPR